VPLKRREAPGTPALRSTIDGEGSKVMMVKTLKGTVLIGALLVGLFASMGAFAQQMSSEAFTVAFLLPETSSSPRWQNDDKPAFINAMKQLDPNAKIIVNSATSGSAVDQQRQAEAAISNGANVLVVTAIDSKAAARIVNEATAAGVKVVAYDRLILNSKLDYYVSFDNVKVGELQGKYIADHVQKGGTVVMIDGAPTDNNAKLFAQGAHNMLDPLFKDGTLTKGYEQYTPDWSASNALNEMEQALTKLNNNVQGVLAANDNTAGGAIQALAAQGLAGKVPVTGQDATNAGLERIIEGTQSMSVYKNVRDEAQAAAKLAVAIATGAQLPDGFVNGSLNNGQVDVPSVLLTPVAVTKDNIATTVISSGYTTWQEICKGAAASSDLCKAHM
jgi:D-xylose transport system substrate-binding protein